MTPEEGLQKQIEIYRSMTGTERAMIGFRLNDLARDLVRNGVRHQHPDWDFEKVEKEVARRYFLAGLKKSVRELDTAGSILTQANMSAKQDRTPLL